MLKEFILIENNKYYQFSNIQEIIKYLLGNNYYNLSKDEQINTMKINALLTCSKTQKEIIDINNNIGNIENIENYFILYDEITYILSLLLTGKYMLLENKSTNVFIKDLTINKENLQDNYVIVNKFASKLLLDYIENI